ncbi:hypothetical protein [Hyphomonas jannaschiana]|uniref:hypothetical protein n=1 Tax=Hyphomonas jannaschiana TaxID=86 RepID=UPI0035C68689
MSPQSTFGTYLMMEEALIVASLLTDGGFNATLDNYGHTSINPFYIPALGGIGISIPTRQLQAAREYVRNMKDTAAVRLEEALQEPVLYVVPKRIRWRAWAMVLISLDPLIILVGMALIWKHRISDDGKQMTILERP